MARLVVDEAWQSVPLRAPTLTRWALASLTAPACSRRLARSNSGMPSSLFAQDFIRRSRERSCVLVWAAAAIRLAGAGRPPLRIFPARPPPPVPADRGE